MLIKPFKLYRFFAIAFILLMAWACASFTDYIDRIEAGSIPPAEMYAYAEDLRMGTINVPIRGERNGERLINKYDWSAYIHDLIERFYPDSPFAALGQLRQGEAYFDEGEYEKAVPQIEEFIRKNPGHPQIDHAYYLSAMSSFVQISTEGLDPSDTKLSILRFNRLLKQRPDSQYKQEAEERILAAKTQLAATEIRLGRTLQNQQNFYGAIARYQTIVKEFDITVYVEEALYRLVESYLSLGIRQEAEVYAKILGNNYPTSPWYRQAYDLINQQNHRKIPGESQGKNQGKPQGKNQEAARIISL